MQQSVHVGWFENPKIPIWIKMLGIVYITLGGMIIAVPAIILLSILEFRVSHQQKSQTKQEINIFIISIVGWLLFVLFLLSPL